MSSPTAPVHIGKTLQHAIVFNPRPRVPIPMNTDDLQGQTADLFRLLHTRQIDYVLVGGLAMLQYVEGRNTQDIDLIMAAASLRRLPELHVQASDINFMRALYGELSIDILPTKNRLFKKVQQRHTTLRAFVEREIPCATVEGLLLLKLYALPSLYRQGNYTRVNLYRSDIGGLLHEYQPNMDAILKELAHHVSESDLREIGRIVEELGSDRIDRFGPGES